MIKDRIKGTVRIALWTLGLALLSLPVQAQELALGSPMPGADGVSLQTVNGEAANLTGFTGSAGTAVIFWSNQCPWIDKYSDRFAALVEDFTERGIRFVLVNSNDKDAYPKESLEESARAADGFPGVIYLADQTSELARSFAAERTPHVYVFDGAGELVYVGTIDDSPGDPNAVTASYVQDALEAVIAGRAVAVSKTKAFGCTIKFKH